MHYCALNEETFFKINVQCQWDQTTISLCFMFSRMFLGFFCALVKIISQFLQVVELQK